LCAVCAARQARLAERTAAWRRTSGVAVARLAYQPLTRAAEMARAVGTHLVLATQRLTVNVDTGFAQGEHAGRVAFSVISQTDSHVILDESGADELLGKGQMLARIPGPGLGEPGAKSLAKGRTRERKTGVILVDALSAYLRLLIQSPGGQRRAGEPHNSPRCVARGRHAWKVGVQPLLASSSLNSEVTS